ncbi:MAG: rhodanese-like domain-containing protein [Candidatus Ranarchaeia archaeon]
MPQWVHEKLEDLPRGVERVIVKMIDRSDGEQLFKIMVFMAGFPELLQNSETIRTSLFDRLTAFYRLESEETIIKLGLLLTVILTTELDDNLRATLANGIREAANIDELTQYGIQLYELLLAHDLITLPNSSSTCQVCAMQAANTEINNLGYRDITVNQAFYMAGVFLDIVILDVRTSEEYSQGHIPGAVLIPYDQLDHASTQLPLSLNTTILVYCGSGVRSQIASQTLMELGYTNVYNMMDGLDAWVTSGYPIVEGDDPGDQEILIQSTACTGNPPSCHPREYACCLCTLGLWDWWCLIGVATQLGICVYETLMCPLAPGPWNPACWSMVYCMLWGLPHGTIWSCCSAGWYWACCPLPT